MKRLVPVIAILLLATTAWARWPETKRDCTICHIFNTVSGRLELKSQGSEMCFTCHPDRIAPSEHSVDMKAPMQVRKLPLQKGYITCYTCHEPHGQSTVHKALRMPPKDLCPSCHIM